ncbi:MAG: LptF/LptG family permease [Williamsia sp.]|nr:LptF/LptG family permease [Williamsia sp.]
MKKLDALILKAFVGPFIATFFITLFVLVLQFFWLWIDDMVGKGLDFLTIAKLCMYVAAFNIPLALPLAILLSSIMTFGNLGETFELVAIKSAGIPLIRFMRPMFLATLVLCGAAFLFNNNIIPVTTLKMQTLKYDIVVSKPALDIKEGVFYDKLEGFVIKIGKKEKDGSTIRNVVIYEKNYGLQDNMIVAKSGQMKVTPDKHFLEFDLNDGWRYEERGNRMTTNTEYIRLGFKQYKKVFDLSSFKLNQTGDSLFKDNSSMLTTRQLDKVMDSLKKVEGRYAKRTMAEVSPYFTFSHYVDTGWVKVQAAGKKPIRSLKDIIPDSARSNVIERAQAQVNYVKSTADVTALDYEAKKRDLRSHAIEWHRKFTMSIACMVLFLIGAPLGSIIRKGGLGMPLVLAVVFFVIFFLLNNFGVKLVKEGVLKPIAGMWMATFILTPVGMFLIYKAMRDSQLFNQEAYFRVFRRIGNLFQKIRTIYQQRRLVSSS